MLHANGSSPTKVHGSQMMRMKREVFPRAPQVSVVTKTVYASSTAITSSPPPQVENVRIPLGPIVGGILGGMLIVIVAVGGWWWWGSRLRASKAKGAKARRAQHLTAARTRHSRTDSTENLKTSGSYSKSHTSLSEKTKEKQPAQAPVAHESVQKPSAILAQERNTRPFMHQTNSSASLGNSRYAPSRPSPLALNVVTRAPSALSENPPTGLVTSPTQTSGPAPLSPQSAALHSLLPLPPKVHVVPPSPPAPVHTLPALATDKNQRQSVRSIQTVQTVASEYSLDSPIGVAYGGDELEKVPYTNPRDEWKSSQAEVMSRMHMAAQARGPFGNA